MRTAIFILLTPLWGLMVVLVGLYATVLGYRINFQTTLNDLFKWLIEDHQ